MSLVRRMMLSGTEEENIMEFKMIDTVTVTPGEKRKAIDLSTYGCTEFLIHGNIPKTANTTAFGIGIGNINFISPRNNSDVYAVEMMAHVYIVNGIAMGFAGFDSGWGGGNAIGTLMQSPRSEAATNIMFAFYPYVDGDEQAYIEIYGR